MFIKDILYGQAVGSLLWLALGTRPDISYAVGQVQISMLILVLYTGLPS